MIRDAIVFVSVTVLYLLDIFIFKLHVHSNPLVANIILLIDLLIISIIVVVPIIEKDMSAVFYGALIFPATSVLYSTVMRIPSVREFQDNISYWQFLLPVAMAYLYIVYKQATTRPMKKTITNRGNVESIGNIGNFPIFINKETAFSEESRYLHTQVIGPTGSGKTFNIFDPWIFQDIRNGAGVFIFDIKADMRERVEKYITEAGRDRQYYRFCLGDPNSATYNPLAGDDAMEISNRVFTALYFDAAKTEQYYLDIAKRFLTSTIAVMMKKWPESNLTFIDLFKAISNPGLYLKPMCNQMLDEGEDLNARYLLDFMKGEDIEKKLSGLLNKVSQFATSAWTKQINDTNPEIDITKILTNNDILLFQANAGVYQLDYKPISVMLMMHLQSEMAKRYTIKDIKPFFLYLDEFADIVYPGFELILNKVRQAKCGITFGHQDIGDLEKAGPAVKKMVLSNSRNKIILTIDDDDTANFFAGRGGTDIIEKKVESFSTKDGDKQAGYTVKEENQFKIHPDELKFLKRGEAWIVLITEQGEKMIKKIKFDRMQYNFFDRKIEPRQEHQRGVESNFKGKSQAEPVMQKEKVSFKNKLSMSEVAKNAPKTIKEAIKNEESGSKEAGK